MHSRVKAELIWALDEKNRLPMYVLRKFGDKDDPGGPSDAEILANTISRIFSDQEGIVFYEIYKMVENGQKEPAIEAFDRVLARCRKIGNKADPMRAACLTGKGMIFVTLGRALDAIECENEALAWQPMNPLATLTLGDAHAQLKSYDEAIHWYDETLALREKNMYECAFILPYHVTKMKARVEVARGDLEKAISFLNRFADIGEQFMDGADALRTRGLYHSLAGHWKDAHGDFSRSYLIQKSTLVRASLMEACLMVDDLTRIRALANDDDDDGAMNAGHRVICEYFAAIERFLAGETKQGVAACVKLCTRTPSPETDWDFGPLNDYIRNRVDASIMAFLVAVQDWIVGKVDADACIAAISALNMGIDTNLKEKQGFDMAEAKHIAALMHAEIMAIPLEVTDEQFKIQCTVIGDHLRYKGIACLGGRPTSLAILFESPRLFRHPDEAEGFEDTLVYKEMAAITDAVCHVWDKYSKFLKNRAHIEIFGDTTEHKEWLTPGGRTWTLSEVVPVDKRDMLKKMLGDPFGI
ncbi:MAG: tetratricopeptide repeat protein [Candidatus Sigynarchaeota archaeon]